MIIAHEETAVNPLEIFDIFPRVEVYASGTFPNGTPVWHWVRHYHPGKSGHSTERFLLAENALRTASAIATASATADSWPVYAPRWVIEALATSEAVLAEVEAHLSQGFGMDVWDAEFGESMEDEEVAI